MDETLTSEESSRVSQNYSLKINDIKFSLSFYLESHIKIISNQQEVTRTHGRKFIKNIAQDKFQVTHQNM